MFSNQFLSAIIPLGIPTLAKRISEEEIKADIRRVYEELNKPPSENEYSEHGEYSVSVVRRRFGRYTDGREAADIPNPDMRGANNKIDRQDLLNEIHRLADELDKTPTREDIQEYGKYHSKPYRRAFGSWSEALIEAGYESSRPGSNVAERVEYECPVCNETGTKLKSQVREQDQIFCSRDCLHQYRTTEFTGKSHPLYHRKEINCSQCGNALQRKPSVIDKKDDFFCDYNCYSDWCSDERTGSDHPRWKGGGDLYYGPNWQSQRRKRLEQDNYECQWCGMSREESKREYGRDLEVHHQRSVRLFYEDRESEPPWDEVNDVDNLITLCLSCHRKVEKLPVQPQFDCG